MGLSISMPILNFYLNSLVEKEPTEEQIRQMQEEHQGYEHPPDAK